MIPTKTTVTRVNRFSSLHKVAISVDQDGVQADIYQTVVISQVGETVIELTKAIRAAYELMLNA